MTHSDVVAVLECRDREVALLRAQVAKLRAAGDALAESWVLMRQRLRVWSPWPDDESALAGWREATKGDGAEGGA